MEQKMKNLRSYRDSMFLYFWEEGSLERCLEGAKENVRDLYGINL
jgi:hypothetical protein